MTICIHVLYAISVHIIIDPAYNTFSAPAPQLMDKYVQNPNFTANRTLPQFACLHRNLHLTRRKSIGFNQFQSMW
jgi:hypothetical protein